MANDDNSLGYKLDGADTVHPFSAKRDIVLVKIHASIAKTDITYTSAKVQCDGVLSYTLSQFNNGPAYVYKNGTMYDSVTAAEEHYVKRKSGTLTVKKGDTLSISLGSGSSNEKGAVFVGSYQ